MQPHSADTVIHSESLADCVAFLFKSKLYFLLALLDLSHSFTYFIYYQLEFYILTLYFCTQMYMRHNISSCTKCLIKLTWTFDLLTQLSIDFFLLL